METQNTEFLWVLLIIATLLRFLLRKYSFLGSTLLCSTPSGTRLRGDPAICPGNSGVFECKTTNIEVLVWNIDGILLSFDGTREVGYAITMSENVASLVELDLINGRIGNRTSLLLVPPASNVTMKVTCSGGNVENTCSRDINFIGNSRS